MSQFILQSSDLCKMSSTVIDFYSKNLFVSNQIVILSISTESHDRCASLVVSWTSIQPTHYTFGQRQGAILHSKEVQTVFLSFTNTYLKQF